VGVWVGVVGLLDIVLTDEDYGMKWTNKDWITKNWVWTCECCNGKLWGLRRCGVSMSLNGGGTAKVNGLE